MVPSELLMVAFIAEVEAKKLVVPKMLFVIWAVPASAVSVPPRVPNCVTPPPPPKPRLLVIVALPAVLRSRKFSCWPGSPVEPTMVILALLAEL